MNQLARIEKMLEALLRSGNHLHWIGGYVYGRTSSDDPFIILYPAWDELREKACRVYSHAFHKLPDFIPTDNVPADTNANPNKGDAQRAGIYHECRHFEITTYDGKETPLGAEKRFGDVLRVSSRPAPGAPPQTNGASSNGASGPTRAKDESERDYWRREAMAATDELFFDTAVANLEPWFQESANVQRFRESLFDDWRTDQVPAYLAALERYAAIRLTGEDQDWDVLAAHKQAKEAALEAFEDVCAQTSTSKR